MLADDRLILRHPGRQAWGAVARRTEGVWPDRVSGFLEGGIPSPHGSPPDRGCTPQFFPHFSLEGVCLPGSDTARKRLQALWWLCSIGWLPLLRVGCLKGL
jgi:hypothetical protein